jgi:hypothetical protein
MRANRKELDENPRYAALYKKAAGKYLETEAKSREGIKKDIDSYYRWWVDFCGGMKGGESHNEMYM